MVSPFAPQAPVGKGTSASGGAKAVVCGCEVTWGQYASCVVGGRRNVACDPESNHMESPLKYLVSMSFRTVSNQSASPLEIEISMSK